MLFKKMEIMMFLTLSLFVFWKVQKFTTWVRQANIFQSKGPFNTTVFEQTNDKSQKGSQTSFNEAICYEAKFRHENFVVLYTEKLETVHLENIMKFDLKLMNEVKKCMMASACRARCVLNNKQVLAWGHVLSSAPP